MGFLGQFLSSCGVRLRPTPESELHGCVERGVFSGDVINVNNRSINMFTAGVNYKFGGWW
jgi:hypothetical protein